jgi:antirestriction protein ArdC
VGCSNPVSKTVYSGINVWLTNIHREDYELKSPLFLTFNQIQSLGGLINKGAKGCTVVYFKMMKSKNDPDKMFPMLRYYKVWNTDQTNIDLPYTIPEDINSDCEFVAGYKDGPGITFRAQDSAYYSPVEDKVSCPVRGQYEDEAAFRSVLYHELAHSTGHEKRLNRNINGGFGSTKYAREELVAEITAAYMVSLSGMDFKTENTAAYLQSWMRKVRDDPKLFVSAASAAEKAVEFLMERRLSQEVLENTG